MRRVNEAGLTRQTLLDQTLLDFAHRLSGGPGTTADARIILELCYFSLKDDGNQGGARE